MDEPIEVAALYGALDSRRNAKGLSWRKLAKELELSPSIFTRLAQGQQPRTGSYVEMTTWLGVSTDAFIERAKPSPQQAENTVETIAGHLRADKALKSESAAAIAKIVETAYEEMAERK